MAKTRLRDVIVPRMPVYYTKDDFFEVRGIALADVIKLSQKHMDKLAELFNDFMERKGSGPISTTVVTDFLVSAVADAPEIVSEIIAIAADEDSPEALANIRALRTPVQLEAMMQIAALSITTEAELKKLTETLATAIKKVTSLAVTLKNGMDRRTADAEEAFRFPSGVSAPVRESIS